MGVEHTHTTERRQARARERLASARCALEDAADELAAVRPLMDRDREAIAPLLATVLEAMTQLREAMGETPEPARRLRLRRGHR